MLTDGYSTCVRVMHTAEVMTDSCFIVILCTSETRANVEIHWLTRTIYALNLIKPSEEIYRGAVNNLKTN